MQLVLLAGTPSARAQSPRTESSIWRQIETLRDQPEDSGPQWFDHALSRRRALLAELANLLLLFPGSTHREAAVALEMDTRWELLALDTSQRAALADRIAELQHNPPNPLIAAEAEYWRLRLAHCAPPAPPTGSAPASAFASDPHIVEWEAFLAAHPDSPRYASICHELLTVHERQKNLPAAERILARAREHCPADPTTRVWAGRLKRWRNIGQPLSLTLPTTAPATPNTRHVLWHISASTVAPRDGRPPRWPTHILRLSSAGVRQTVVLMGPANVPADLPTLPGLAMHIEPIGLSGDYARDWGITHLPTVFFISSDGRLDAVCESESEIEDAIRIDIGPTSEKTTP